MPEPFLGSGNRVFNTTYMWKRMEVWLLYNNGNLHYFTNFTGTKNSALYWFYLSLYKVPLGFLPNSRIIDTIPLNQMFGGLLKVLQDFVAPLYLFLKIDFELKMKEAGDILSSGDIEMDAIITKKILGNTNSEFHSSLKINQVGEIEISVEFKEARIKIYVKTNWIHHFTAFLFVVSDKRNELLEVDSKSFEL